jgi:endonuclease G, mitochondrial
VKNAAIAAVPVALALMGGAIAPTPSHPGHAAKTAHMTLHQPAGLSPADQALADENCPFGLPTKDPAWDHGPTAFVARRGYALEESSVDKIPIWVCEHVEKSEIQGSAERRDKFLPDPKLDKGKRSELSDYSGFGFDRGHMAPAGNQKKSQTLNDETFYLSNMSPQVGIGFNRAIWAHLEDQTRDWVKSGSVTDEYILTGPIFFDPKEENEATANGVINFETIGDDAVAVPTHFYKIILGKTSSGGFKTVAFVLPNEKHKGPEDFTVFIQSIDWIEEHTGLDFMPKLTSAQEEELERHPGKLFE